MVPSLFSAPLRVLLLAGGPSAEREISLESGAAVRTALEHAGHCVTMFDPREGHLNGIERSDYDIAYVALHGPFGEDGQVQQLLEQMGLPYTGSDSRASQVAMSKSATKQRLLEQGLPTPAYVMIYESDYAHDIRRKASTIGFPLVVKPDSQGSSLGVTIVGQPHDLPAALNRCFHFGSVGLMEAAVTGTEWTVGVIDDLVLPPIQIVADAEFYDFDSKYRSDATKYLFETDLVATQKSELSELARAACDCLGTTGIARVDFRQNRFQQPWILEVNTIPGMTAHSLVPKAAMKIGLSFIELCERALQSGLARPVKAPSTRAA